MSGLWELFLKGGPIMWPILLLSIVTGGVVLERFWFLITAGRRSKAHEWDRSYWPTAPLRRQKGPIGELQVGPLAFHAIDRSYS
jgi:biopolymer transport protein ExbB/TolQ